MPSSTSVGSIPADERRLVEPDQELAESRWFRRGQAHGFDNLTDEDASMLVVSTPGLFGEDCFRSISEPVAAASGRPPDLAAMVSTAPSLTDTRDMRWVHDAFRRALGDADGQVAFVEDGDAHRGPARPGRSSIVPRGERPAGHRFPQ